MTEVAVGRGEALRRSWRNRALRRVLVAFLVFNVSDWACYIALLVWAFERGGVRAASLIVLIQFVPAALLASPAAARLGRLPATRALPLGYAAQVTTVGLTGTALLLDQSLAVVGPLAALTAVSVSLTRPLHNALLPAISDTTAELTAGNAATGSAEAAATLIGPLVSGTIIAVWAPGGVLLVMALCAVGSTLLVLGLGKRAARTQIAAPATEAPLRAVLRDPAARLLSGLVFAEYMLVGMMDILLVVLALQLLDLSASGPGWLNAAIGAGGLLGAALTVVLVGAKRLAPALCAGAIIAGLPIALTGTVPWIGAAVLLIAAAGAGKTFFEVTARTFTQRVLPDRLLTAVFGMQESLRFAGTALGSLTARVLVEQLGATAAFVAAGLFLPTVALLALPALRRHDASTQVPLHVLSLLREVSFLSVLPPRLVERLALSARVEARPAGTRVVTEGETGDRFYVVEWGELAVTHDEVELRRLGPGDWFGELALLRDSPRTATVTALSQVLLHTVDRETFLTTLAVTPRSRGLADQHAQEHYR